MSQSWRMAVHGLGMSRIPGTQCVMLSCHMQAVGNNGITRDKRIDGSLTVMPRASLITEL